MKKLYLAFLYWLFTFWFLHGQTNIVPNPSFEMYTTCPNNIGQFNYVTDWNILYESPDYYNACASPVTAPNSSVPNNFLGYQYPSSGNAYAGFTTYISGESPPYREIIGTQLTNSLVIGQKYYVSFKLNLTLGYNSNSGANKTGLRFSNIQHSVSNPPPVNNVADVYTTSVITDTLNWTTVFGSFTADSSYSFIELGNFFDDSNTTVHPLRYQTTNWSYYYIDDICISTDSLYSLNWVYTNPTTSNNYLSQPKENIYPNPSTGKVFIELNGFYGQSKISVRNVIGTEIKEIEMNPGSNAMDFEDSGVYFITITNGSFQTTRKVIINK